jgi:uncharacterized membrane protein
MREFVMPIWAGKENSLLARILLHIRRTMVAGTLAALPLIVTYWVVRWLFGFLDGLFAPVVDRAIGFHIPGIGLLISLAVFYVFGMLSANFLGRQVESGLELLMSRLPVLRAIYSSAKQVVDTLSATKRRGGQKVVLVEFPAPGHYMVGFVTRDIPAGMVHPEGTLAVFVPTSPNPTSGALLFLPASSVLPTSMTTEEAFKIVLSGGVIAPLGLGREFPLPPEPLP